MDVYERTSPAVLLAFGAGILATLLTGALVKWVRRPPRTETQMGEAAQTLLNMIRDERTAWKTDDERLAISSDHGSLFIYRCGNYLPHVLSRENGMDRWELYPGVCGWEARLLNAAANERAISIRKKLTATVVRELTVRSQVGQN